MNSGPKEEGWIELRNHDLLSRPMRDHGFWMLSQDLPDLAIPQSTAAGCAIARGVCQEASPFRPSGSFQALLGVAGLHEFSLPSNGGHAFVSTAKRAAAERVPSADGLERHSPCTLFTLAELLFCPAIEIRPPWEPYDAFSTLYCLPTIWVPPKREEAWESSEGRDLATCALRCFEACLFT